MACVCVVVSLGSLRCSWFAGNVSVAFRDNAMSRLLGGHGLSTLCMTADIASALNMKMRVCLSVPVRLSSSGVQSFNPIFHRGARCLSNLSEYLSGWHSFRGCLAYSLGCRLFMICWRRLALILSTTFMAVLMLVAL